MDLMGTDGISTINTVLNIFGMLITVFFLPLIILVIGLVLYYFGGNKKKADEFLPNLMSQGIRTFGYVWIFFISLGIFISLIQILTFIFGEILPKRKSFFASNVNDSDILVQGGMLLVVMLIWLGFVYKLNRKNFQVSKIASTLSAKYSFIFGMIFYSIVLFISSILLSVNLVDFLNDTSNGLDSTTFAVFFSSLIIFGIYLIKSLKILEFESNENK